MDIWAARPRDSLVFREISEHDLHLTYTSRRLHVARIVSQLSTFLSRSPLSPAQMSQPLPPRLHHRDALTSIILTSGEGNFIGLVLVTWL